MFKNIDYPAWIGTIALIILFREASVWITSQFGHPELGNLLGLIALLIVLSTVRVLWSIPARLIDTTNKLMRESGFAFVPQAAGSCFAIFVLGDDLLLFVIILLVSTLLPLWGYAKLAKRFL
ncbi:MAG: hypothetical protein Q4D05_09205 [Acinetobacter sp.]|nr:hypothetical protein [Acinetobacter sp.]MDO4224178.1 hypothetical protein [Acinetobacter sp.]